MMRSLSSTLIALLLGGLISWLALRAWPEAWLAAGSGPMIGGILWLYLRHLHQQSIQTELACEALGRQLEDATLAERRLHLFRSVVDSSAEMIYVFRAHDGGIVYANESISRETGFSLAELLNRHITVPFESLDVAASTAALRNWIENAKESKLTPQEASHRLASGESFPISMRASMIQHEEQQFVVAVVEDITVRKQRDQDLADTQEMLTQLSRMDGLLAIANRRRFDEAFESEWNRAARQGAFISLVLADIDQFKQYNDRYGHPAGDRCLQKVAQVFNDSIFRPADLVARYGGEELAVLLPETEAIGAKLVAEDLRAGVQSLSLAHEGSSVAKEVTISLGVGTIRPSSATGPAEFIQSVDKALYRAKELGRNRVETTQTLAVAPTKEQPKRQPKDRSKPLPKGPSARKKSAQQQTP